MLAYIFCWFFISQLVGLKVCNNTAVCLSINNFHQRMWLSSNYSFMWDYFMVLLKKRHSYVVVLVAHVICYFWGYLLNWRLTLMSYYLLLQLLIPYLFMLLNTKWFLMYVLNPYKWLGTLIASNNFLCFISNLEIGVTCSSWSYD